MWKEVSATLCVLRCVYDTGRYSNFSSISFHRILFFFWKRRKYEPPLSNMSAASSYQEKENNNENKQMNNINNNNIFIRENGLTLNSLYSNFIAGLIRALVPTIQNFMSRCPARHILLLKIYFKLLVVWYCQYRLSYIC